MEDKYRGFNIEHVHPPIPIRSHDWRATSEDYDASYEGPEDGWKTSGESFNAETREELIELIDEYWEENADEDAHSQTQQ